MLHLSGVLKFDILTQSLFMSKFNFLKFRVLVLCVCEYWLSQISFESVFLHCLLAIVDILKFGSWTKVKSRKTRKNRIFWRQIRMTVRLEMWRATSIDTGKKIGSIESKPSRIWRKNLQLKKVFFCTYSSIDLFSFELFIRIG